MTPFKTTLLTHSFPFNSLLVSILNMLCLNLFVSTECRKTFFVHRFFIVGYPVLKGVDLNSVNSDFRVNKDDTDLSLRLSRRRVLQPFCDG